MLYINVYVSLSSTRISCRFGRMPEYVLSKVLGGAIIMGRREYSPVSHFHFMVQDLIGHWQSSSLGESQPKSQPNTMGQN